MPGADKAAAHGRRRHKDTDDALPDQSAGEDQADHQGHQPGRRRRCHSGREDRDKQNNGLGIGRGKKFETNSTSRTRTALFRDVKRGGRRKDQAQAQKSDKPRPTSARPRLAIDIALALLTGPAGSTPHTAQTNGKPNVVQIPALVPLVIDERTTATKIRTREYERGNEDAEHAGQNKHGTQFKVFPTRRRCRSSHGHRNNAPRSPAYSSPQCGRCGADL